ncbi:MAG TPA: crosslink repair DNA glycosylase YcaQ family protein [Candidatus Limnocylindrales bacterium]
MSGAGQPSATPRPVDPAVARRFLVLRHLLAPPRALPPGAESVLAVVDRLGSLQFDPLEVAGRNHDLVLQARIRGYRRQDTDELLYDRRLLFEAYNKGLSLLPTRELPWYRHTWDRHAERHGTGAFVEHREAVEVILARIRADGPLASIDFERGRPIDWYWGPTSQVRALLEALAEAGILGLARREGNRRYYDLLERLLPADLLAERIPEREQILHRLLSRFRAHGLLAAGGSSEIWLGTAPARAGRGRLPGPGRDELLPDLLARGELLPVAVGGLPAVRYLIADELPLLAQAEREIAAGTAPGAVKAGVTFLAPLDPLAWDRYLLRRLFGFDYVWEVYVPAERRRWGYYVLPLLFGDRFVGRIEPRIDRRTGQVRVLGLWWEAGFEPLAVPGFVAAFSDALADYLAFAGASRVRLPRTAVLRPFGAAVRAALADRLERPPRQRPTLKKTLPGPA